MRTSGAHVVIRCFITPWQDKRMKIIRSWHDSWWEDITDYRGTIRKKMCFARYLMMWEFTWEDSSGSETSSFCRLPLDSVRLVLSSIYSSIKNFFIFLAFCLSISLTVALVLATKSQIMVWDCEAYVSINTCYSEKEGRMAEFIHGKAYKSRNSEHMDCWSHA